MAKQEWDHSDFEVLRYSFSLKDLLKRESAAEGFENLKAEAETATISSSTQQAPGVTCTYCQGTDNSEEDILTCESQECGASYHINCIDKAVAECGSFKDGKYKPSNIIFCPKCTNRGRGGVEVGVKIEKKSLVCLNLKPGLKKAEVETIRQILQGRNVIGGMSADEKKSYIAQRIVKRKLSSS